MSLITLILVVLLIAVLAGGPLGFYPHTYGYGGAGLLLIIIIVLLLAGRL